MPIIFILHGIVFFFSDFSYDGYNQFFHPVLAWHWVLGQPDYLHHFHILLVFRKNITYPSLDPGKLYFLLIYRVTYSRMGSCLYMSPFYYKISCDNSKQENNLELTTDRVVCSWLQIELILIYPLKEETFLGVETFSYALLFIDININVY